MNKPIAKKVAPATPAPKKVATPETTPKKTATPGTARPKKTSVSPDIRKYVAENLRNWMRADPNLDTQVKVSDASGVGQTTVSRILLGTTPATADILYAIAKAFGRDPGDLLTTEAESNIQYDVEKFSQLPDYEKIRIEGFIKHVLNEYENPTGASKKKASR